MKKRVEKKQQLIWSPSVRDSDSCISTSQRARENHIRGTNLTHLLFFFSSSSFSFVVAVVRYKSGSLFGSKPRILLPYTYDDLYLFALFGLWTELLESTEVLSKSKTGNRTCYRSLLYTILYRGPSVLLLAMCGVAHMYSLGITELNQCGLVELQGFFYLEINGCVCFFFNPEVANA